MRTTSNAVAALALALLVLATGEASRWIAPRNDGRETALEA